MPGQDYATPATTPAPPSTEPPSNDSGGIGNAAAAATLGGAATAADPTWASTAAQLIPVQNELRRIGLYRMTVDGVWGRGSAASLVEAFGDDSWRTMDQATVLSRLRAVQTPTGDEAERHFRMGEMTRDGLLDVTIGLGFDEGGSQIAILQAFTDAFAARGFTIDSGRAAELYAAAGRNLENSDVGQYWVKEDALTYNAPAGGTRTVPAVIRFLNSGDGEQGAEMSDAFSEGMTEGDIAYYGGHGRYGSGPDFDRNMSFDLLAEDGSVEQHIDDYEVLETVLHDEGAEAHRDAWAQFQWRLTNHRIDVIGSNEGNVFLNPTDMHSSEFGAKLMYWNLQQSGSPADLQTGAGGELAERHQENPEHRYTLAVFNGCRTQDYTRSLRSTEGMDSRGADVIASTRVLYWTDMANTMAAFLDSVLSQQSVDDTVSAMDAQNVTERPAGAAGASFDDF